MRHGRKRGSKTRQQRFCRFEPLEDRRLLTGIPRAECLQFDGEDDYVEIAPSSELSLSQNTFTIEAWIKPRSWGDRKQGRIVDHGGGSAGEAGWTFQLMNSKKFVNGGLAVQINGQIFTSDPDIISLNSWQHVAATFNNNTLTFYVDGVAKGSHTGVPVPETRNDPVRVGMRATDMRRAFEGDIDDIRVWDTARTATQLQDNMNKELAGSEAGLAAYYRLNEGSGQIAGDATGQSLDGRLGSSPSSDASDPEWIEEAPANKPPVAQDDSASTVVDTAVDVDVLKNDQDPDGTLDSSSVTLVPGAGPSSGQATVLSDGTIRYTPDNGFSGNDSFRYTVEDDDGAVSNEATVTVTVRTENQPPVAKDDSAATTTDTAIEIQVLSNDQDADGTLDNSTVTIVNGAGPTNGQATVLNDGRIRYTPSSGFNGTDQFRYTVDDNEGATSNEATVNVQVSPGGGSSGPKDVFLRFDGKNDIVDIDDTNPLDLTDGAFTLEAWIHPREWGERDQGRIIDHGGGSAGEEGWTFQLMNRDKFVLEGLVVQINGQVFTSDADSVVLNTWQHVAATFENGDLNFYVNGELRGSHQNVPVPKSRNAPVRIGRRATDGNRAFGGDIDEVRIWNSARTSAELMADMNKELQGSESGLVGYYKMNEGGGQFILDATGNNQTGTLGTSSSDDSEDPDWVGQAAGNQSPVAKNDSDSTLANEPVEISVLANDSDPDGTLDTGSVQIVTGGGPQNGQVTVLSDGRIRYTPNTDFTGTDQFLYTVLDNEGARSNEARVTVTVTNPANQPPVAVDDQATTAQETAATIDVLANDRDDDGTLDTGSVQIVANGGPSNGQVVVQSDGKIRYTPNDNFSGSDEFRYTVADNEGARSNEATVTVQVTSSSGSKPKEKFLAFDGNNDFVHIDHAAALDLNDGAFTLEAWINPESWGGANQGRVIDHGGGSSGNAGWTLQLMDNSSFVDKGLALQINGDMYVSDANVVSIGQWQHVAVVYDQGTATFYVDGVAKGTQSNVPSPEVRTDPVAIGRRATDDRRGFDGYIDEVRIWDRALRELTFAHRNNELTGSEAGLVAYYRMNEGVGQSVADGSPLNHNGQLGSTSGSDSEDPSWLCGGDDSDDSSPVIADITFDWSSHIRLAPGSDNWPMTWAADGHQYTAWGDGGGFGGTGKDGRVSLGVGRVEGPSDNYTGYNVWGGKNAENPAKFQGKSYGLLSVDGVLYMWVMVENKYFEESRLYYSNDNGASWKGANWTFNHNSAFSVPAFIQYGKDYQDAPDNYVYFYSPGEKELVGAGFNPADTVDLVRVPKNKMLDRSAYEFFAGLDAQQNPTWTSDLTQRAPVYSDPGRIHWTMSVSYIPGIDRYLLFNNGDDKYFGKKGAEGNLEIYDAPNPWGPWTHVKSYTGDWGDMGYTFTYFVAPKWISADGKSFTLVFSGDHASDSWNTVDATITLR